MDANERVEALGPAERIINAITQFTDHAVHNRPGIVVPDARHRLGVRWEQATWVKEGGQKVVYKTHKVGRRSTRTRVGIGVPGTIEVRDGTRTIGTFRRPGLFPEVVVHLYQQIADVWKMDNEFAARWASWAFENDDNRDLKVILAAFLLVQNRFGEFVQDGDSTFRDDDYRAVGEAMCLVRLQKKGATFNPKMILRVGLVLEVPGVIEINRKLGFGQSARRAIRGRYETLVRKWLRHSELNPKVLEQLVKGGFASSVTALAAKVRYKPVSDKFFGTLRWKQVQAVDGRRQIAIGKAVKKAESWEGLTEAQICTRIVKGKMSYKRVVGMLPADVGLTPAIMSATIEVGGLSDSDLIILTPTLEELGLLKDKDIEARWKGAMERAENQRAANIARNVKREDVKEALEEAADKATAKAVEEVTRDLRIYVVVDKSGSMEGAIEKAKEYLAKFVGAFPLDKLHVSVFNTMGREVEIKAATKAAVTQAFRGHTAGGGTSYAAGIGCLVSRYKPAENEDAIFIFVGDEGDNNIHQLVQVIRASGVIPVSFGLLHVQGNSMWGWGGTIVKQAAVQLGIPCFDIEEGIFADPYAVPRTIRNLIASTPVTRVATPAAPVRRVSLIKQILDTPLLQKPVWA